MGDYEEQVEVDFEKGEIVAIKKSKYKLWHDFGGVKRFFVYADMGYVKYIEKREDGLYLVTADVEQGIKEEQISEEEARDYVADAVNHWISD